LAEGVYVDSFGNAITGLRVATLPEGATVAVGERTLPRAEKFVDVSEGEPFWYENSNGLVEIAANRARAVEVLALAVGAPVTVAKM
jgi:S-adenosylmethionine hydrolase